MAKLIDADAFIEMMEEKCDHESAIDEWILAVCKGGINKMLPVDAVEVVHGEWTGLISEDLACVEGFGIGMTEEQKIKYLEDFYHRTHCSVCNCCFDDRETKNWNYCPNCGANMDGGKEDEM